MFLSTLPERVKSSSSRLPDSAGWMRPVLRCAGIYNLAWGLWVIVWPHASMLVCRYPERFQQAPEFWQCIGMIVGVYGVGYWIAARDPIRHWPIVLVGLLGKFLGPLGFLWGWMQGTLPLAAGLVNIPNDLIWWGPFVGILWGALRSEAPESSGLQTLSGQLGSVTDQNGTSLLELSGQQPLLVVFLRHLGCTFCREALSDLRQTLPEIEQNGSRLVLVHLSNEAAAGKLFARYQLQGISRVADPEQTLYRAFRLPQGTFSQLFGWPVFSRGVQAALWGGHGVGLLQGNGFRLPGVFLLHQGKILREFRHQNAAERPDYCVLSIPPGESHVAGSCCDAPAGSDR